MTIASEIESFRAKLATDHKWALRGLFAVFANQTADEQNRETTDNLNGIGFTGTDAKILSSFAKQAQKKVAFVESKGWNVHWHKMLSPKQFAILFKKMPKYAKQLHNGVRAKAQEAEAAAAQDAEISMEIEQAEKAESFYENMKRGADYQYKGYLLVSNDVGDDDCQKIAYEVIAPNAESWGDAQMLNTSHLGRYVTEEEFKEFVDTGFISFDNRTRYSAQELQNAKDAHKAWQAGYEGKPFPAGLDDVFDDAYMDGRDAKRLDDEDAAKEKWKANLNG